MAYVDGFVIVVPKRLLGDYRRMARQGAKLWMEHGALEYIECVGDDLKPTGMGNTFPKVLKLKRGETVVFSWIYYKSKSHRDQVNKRVMKDPRMDEMMEEGKSMPFDMKRFLYGGFKTIVEA
jgi:uncharacterized protein YbaA (DUF1428 family)